jgi:glycosyltransferase involved in cell wall biosynthesis
VIAPAPAPAMPPPPDRRPGAATIRVAVVLSHPIQYFAPLYRALARVPEFELKVFFGAKIGLEPYFDRDMQVELAWRTDLVEGYPHAFTDRADTVRRVGFWQLNDPSVGRLLSAFAPQVVIIYGYSQLNQLRALLWARRRRVPVLMTGDSSLLAPRPALVRLVKQALLRPLFGQIRGFLTVGDGNEAYYRHYGVEAARLFRAPLNIDEPLFAPVRAGRAPARRAFRAELGIPETAFVVLAVGKLIPRKRPQDLVRACRALRARAGPEPHVLFVGDGELRPALETEVRSAGLAGCCRVLGFFNLDRLPAAYAAADVLALPSALEPYGLVVREAAFVGLPLVLSDRVGAIGPTDIARPGVNAKVYPWGDTAALARCLQELIDDPAEYRRMARASRAIAAETGLEATVAGFRRAIGAACGGRGDRAPCGGAAV